MTTATPSPTRSRFSLVIGVVVIGVVVLCVAAITGALSVKQSSAY